MTCRICKFALKLEIASDQVLCRRYPPAQLINGIWSFPAMMDTGWCGEFALSESHVPVRKLKEVPKTVDAKVG